MTTPTTYQLICEGGCNPTLPAVDREVEALQLGRVHYGVPLRLQERLRALRHTIHQEVGGTRAVCLACGTERRYGRYY